MAIWEYKVKMFQILKKDKIVKKYERDDMIIEKYIPNYDAEYHPVALEAHLNELGTEGWELVSIKLGTYAGPDGQLLISCPAEGDYLEAYYCVFKRQQLSEL